ncbi:MAG: LemA family protein [bacterium]
MKTKYIVIGILLVLVVIGLWFAGQYNAFVSLDQETKNAWAQVENQYQRRYDLVPNLVETVKGVAAQEQAVYLGVAEARAKVGQMQISPETFRDPVAFKQFEAAQGEFSSAISRLLVTVENYPVLKSNENFLALQTQLEGAENRISVERKRFNDAAMAYNKKAKGVPGVWLASMFGMEKEKQMFEAVVGTEQPPQVKF